MLDEPVAALDPLARREFLASLAGAVADGGLTVLLSSHLLPDLERVCDHLVLLAEGAARALLGYRRTAGVAQGADGDSAFDTTAIEREHHVVGTRPDASVR